MQLWYCLRIAVAKHARNSLNMISSTCAMLMPSCFLSGDIIAQWLYRQAGDYKMLRRIDKHIMEFELTTPVLSAILEHRELK